MENLGQSGRKTGFSFLMAWAILGQGFEYL